MNWDELASANRHSWDRSSESHAQEWYRIERFRDGQLTLDEFQLAEVGPVSGKTLLHLMCSVGLDTLSWVREGAIVTGVDFSPESVRIARSFSEEFGLAARFVCADVYQSEGEIEEAYDVVYTSQGVMCWLNDLEEWGRIVARFLKPGGFFYIMEEHPFSIMLEDDEPRPSAKFPYFHDREPDHTDDETYQWYWSLSDIVNSLIRAGLRIQFLNEHPVTFYQRVPYMESEDGRWWRVPGYEWPLMFTLKAAKP